MDKYNIVFIKTPFSDVQLLGRKAEDYTIREFAQFEATKCRLSKLSAYKEDVALSQEHINVVLTLDMPLVKVKDILQAVERMRTYNVKAISLSKNGSNAKISFGKAKTEGVFCSNTCFLQIDDAKSLNLVYNQLRQDIIERHLESGVYIQDTHTTFIDDTVKIQRGVKILPFCRIEGSSEIKGDAVIAGSYIRDSIVDGASVEYSHIIDSHVHARASVGPFARLRSATICEGCRIGDFVEIKASKLAEGVKASHLSYVGNADVGEHTNVGCGSVFCNYDGVNKHKTTVGANCFLGANTNLIAPVVIGDNSFIAAGTTVTRDVEEESFTIGRVKQATKPKRNGTE